MMVNMRQAKYSLSYESYQLFILYVQVISSTYFYYTNHLKFENNNRIYDSQIRYLEFPFHTNRIIKFYSIKMNMKKIISSNNKHKKLILTQNYQTTITNPPQKNDKNELDQSNKQNIKIYAKDDQKHELLNISSMQKKFRYSTGSLKSNINHSPRKSAKIIMQPRTKRSNSTNIIFQRLKITQTVESYTRQLLNCRLIKNHFNNYLVEPKNFNKILLFLYKSIKISRNSSQLLKNLKVKSKLTQLEVQLQRQEFDLRYSFKDSRLLNINSNVISLSYDDNQTYSYEKARQKQKNITMEKRIIEMSQKIRRYDIQSQKIRCLQHEAFKLLENTKKIQNKVAHYQKNAQILQKQIKQKTVILQKLSDQQKYIFKVFKNLDQHQYRKIAVQIRQQEQQMFDLVDYDRIHPLGVRNYQRPKFAAKLQVMLQSQQKQFEHFLSNCSNKQNQFLIKTFLNRTKNDYRCLLQDLVDAIAQKTQFIQSTSIKIRNWKSIRLKSKQMLDLMCKGVSLQVLSINKLKRDDSRYDCQQLRQQISKLESSTDKLFGAFKMAQYLF